MADYDQDFEELHKVAFRVAYRLLRDRDAAQDIAQEALARAFMHWRRLRRGTAVAWIAKVSTNLVIDEWRRRQATAARGAEVPDHGAASDSRMDIRSALAGLPRRQREAVVLRYLADLSESTAARMLGCSEGSIKANASRGVAKLRIELGEGDDRRETLNVPATRRS